MCQNINWKKEHLWKFIEYHPKSEKLIDEVNNLLNYLHKHFIIYA